MIDSLSLVLRLRPRFYPVFGSNWTQIGPKFLRARLPQCSTELLTLNERNGDFSPIDPSSFWYKDAGIFLLTTGLDRSKLPGMKPTIVFSLFLVTSLVFAQNPADVKFQDASPKGAPASLSVKYDPDIGLYAAVRNTSGKGILAFFAIIEPTDSRGQSVPCHSRADFIFKDSVLAPQAERFACPMDTSTSSNEPGATVVKAVGAVLWVQFEDGSTWGDAESGKQILSVRSRKLAFLQKLVADYYDNGETSFKAMLNDQNLDPRIWAVAGCLVEDAKSQRIPAINLAKNRLEAAQKWESLLGPF